MNSLKISSKMPKVSTVRVRIQLKIHWPGLSHSENESNCCLNLVFVGFNLLSFCWLAGANDEVHSFKFNPNPNF